MWTWLQNTRFTSTPKTQSTDDPSLHSYGGIFYWYTTYISEHLRERIKSTYVHLYVRTLEESIWKWWMTYQRRHSYKHSADFLVESLYQGLYYPIMYLHSCQQLMSWNDYLNQTPHMSKHRVEWKLIACCVPWYGRYWECLIGLTKKH